MKRKGRRMQVIKGRQVIAVCENAGDAMRLTQVHRDTICRRLQDGGTTKGYRFVEIGR
jgi:hypothetical protein